MYVKVRVKADAKKEIVREVSKTNFEISVRQKPLQNLANKRVVELVAKHFRVPLKQVRIVSGHKSPSKILSLPD